MKDLRNEIIKTLNNELEEISFNGNVDNKTTDKLRAKLEGICSEFIDEYRNADELISDMINEFADSQVDIYTDDIWKSAYDFRFFTEQATKKSYIKLNNDISMKKIFQTGQFLAYQTGLNANVEGIAKSMTLRNVLDNVEEQIDKIDELNLSLSDDKKVEFIDEIKDYIDEIVNEIVTNEVNITDLETKNGVSLETLIDDYKEVEKEILDDELELDM